MTNFHEHKLWQESYVALMDLENSDIAPSAKEVAATIADSLTRADRRIARELLQVAVGLVAKTRTELAVAWGRGLMDDEMFKKLDDKYAALSSSLQSFR
ncbi:MAG: hypothetical protein AAB481_01085 [Patescibacteria group bacterium]